MFSRGPKNHLNCIFSKISQGFISFSIVLTPYICGLSFPIDRTSGTRWTWWSHLTGTVNCVGPFVLLLTWSDRLVKMRLVLILVVVLVWNQSSYFFSQCYSLCEIQFFFFQDSLTFCFISARKIYFSLKH